MPSPLPGMDPYLEHPSAWANIHHRLITAIADDLAPQLLPKYQVLVEERIYQETIEDSVLIGVPDLTIQQSRSAVQPSDQMGGVAMAEPSTQANPRSITLTVPKLVRQKYLEVREIATGQVVTVIEVLSPVDKGSGDGRIDYENKRAMIFSSLCNMVEIDLLRQGKPMPEQTDQPRSHYRILVSAQEKRPQADLYAFNLQDSIPMFPLPLRSDDPLPWIDLKVMLDGIYDRSGYGFVIDYSQAPTPALTETDLAWVRQCLGIEN
jgi:Protein of unknown function (DUF4058)